MQKLRYREIQELSHNLTAKWLNWDVHPGVSRVMHSTSLSTLLPQASSPLQKFSSFSAFSIFVQKLSFLFSKLHPFPCPFLLHLLRTFRASNYTLFFYLCKIRTTVLVRNSHSFLFVLLSTQTFAPIVPRCLKTWMETSVVVTGMTAIPKEEAQSCSDLQNRMVQQDGSLYLCPLLALHLTNEAPWDWLLKVHLLCGENPSQQRFSRAARKQSRRGGE